MELDNRGLQPPEPMVRIMSALEKLPPDEALEVLMDRRPIPLFAILTDRGYQYETDDLPGGGCRLTIRRNP